jgi:cysteine desulfurase
MRDASPRPRSNSLYLDYAASTPMASEVFRAMKPYFSDKFGNPGSLHSFGQEAMAAVDRSREVVARALGAKFREIIFTGSATEANNLALRGATAVGISRLIVSSIEHESVLETARSLKKNGVEVVELPVDKQGVVKLDALAAALKIQIETGGRPALVSVMYANNETGTIQPIAAISKIVHEANSLLHVDASQAFQFLDCNADVLGADLLTLSGHKIYGPKGVGVLYSRTKTKIVPALTGGGQEFGLRSGTENVPLVVGFAAAVEYIEKDREKHSRRIASMKARLFKDLKKIYPKMQTNGGKESLPNILNIWIPGMLAQDILIRLDLAGIAVSAGSACAARSSQPSHVLRAMGPLEARAKESLRISLGRPTTTGDIARLIKALSSL